jgi:hypothetical protein
MGIVLKSTIGLGTVYFLMFFSPSAERPALGPVASVCAEAAAARAQGSDSFASEARAARCLMALNAAAAPLRMSQAETPAPPPPARPAAKTGGLTDADLAEPWFGPAGLSRKNPRRG